ncbi:acyltransferase [Paenibacillus sp. CGMCC 1.16610]|uniref:Acyltransferase family protein n=1 Tax=Paenibacillus anseongense TaxID=2682845 RepID=A0ABW9U185_9BACL|nr:MULTISPECIES: acyltransferase [Paenibacillus]MBA2943346.1 acyltransferase [Paenibacillus sp. CGMCC 1.16610]MVQ33844.1 acyltransferase family protein [Paenibacillus anseongense]
MHSRYDELDSLRGLAALAVMMLHFYGIFSFDQTIKFLIEYSPLRIFISGGEAVILFFVLSGFVLSLPYYNNKQSNYLPFIVKRVFRIYIPYIVAMIGAIICKELFYHGKIYGLSGYFNSFWNLPISSQLLKEHLILIGTFLSNLDPVVWSLVHEMRISIIFPILMYILIKLSWKKGIGLALSFSLASVILFTLFKYDVSTATGTELVATINYTGMFIFGALLARHREFIQNKFMGFSVKHKVLLFVLGLMMYAYLHPSFAIKMFIFHNIDLFYRTVIDSWAVTFGAAILIITAMSSSLFSRILRNKVINHLGKVSYSFYLIHVIILYACVHALHRTISVWAICLIAFFLTIIVSSIMYTLVEKPSMILGKLLFNKNMKVKRLPKSMFEKKVGQENNNTI